MNNVYLFLLLVVTFLLGVLLGEGWAPISGLTPQALAVRVAVLEGRIATLETSFEQLKALIDDVTSPAVFPDAGK